MRRAPTTVVTGAAGYLGRALVRALDRAGHRLVLVDRVPWTDAKAAPRDRELLLGEARDLPDLLRERVPRLTVDHVVHAATVTAAPGDEPAAVVAYLDDHLAASLAALRVAADHGATAVLVSSAAVFAPGQRGELDEAVAPHGTGPYAAAKRAAELAWAEAAAAGLRAGTVRLGNLYGGGERPSPSRPRVSLLQGYLDDALHAARIVVARPDALRDWTFLPDAAARLARLLDDPGGLPERVHLVAPQACTDLHLARTIAHAVPGTCVDVATVAGDGPRGVLTSRSSAARGPWTPLEQGIATHLEALRRHEAVS